MACEKPIVATSGIGLEEVLDDASILVPPANPHPLANAIKEIFDNADLRTRLGKRAREKVITDYNWREVVSRINNLFEMAVKEKT
jgi:glycosyltransferase involved in cell wall biosynthesis